jgi:hypothetical protein
MKPLSVAVMVGCLAGLVALVDCSDSDETSSAPTTSAAGGSSASGGSAAQGGAAQGGDGGASCVGGYGGYPGPNSYQPPTESSVLDTLVAGHPRLIVDEAVLQRIVRSIDCDPVPAGYYEALIEQGDDMLDDPVSERVLVGPRLLSVSRTVLKRIYTLGLLYRIGGQSQYLDRAVEELLAVAEFSDWNPSHFLDVAEMTHAFAIGYDWLYQDLSDADRATIKQAIVDKGLLPAEEAYQNDAWWTDNPFNWNNVCNGGIAIGALAVADEEPELARWLLYRNITNLPAAIASYAPDGAWAEGPGYWGYATRYTVAAFAALLSALGTDFGLSTLEGMAEAGQFRVSMVGPTGYFFNFADAGQNAGRAPTLFWLSRRYDRALYAYSERQYAGSSGSYSDLIWYDDRGAEADLLALGADARFEGADVVTLRSSWTEPNAVYVGFKGGDNQANHSHLDLGTFVLDALGHRWAMDLGPDDYNLPGYFGAERYTYYRLATEGQNTLLIGNTNQDEDAAAPITAFETSSNGAFAIADLTQGYAPVGASSVRRGIALLDGRDRVLVRDEISLSSSNPIRWSMHTMADIATSAQTATLTQEGTTVEVRLLSPSGASFTWQDIALQPPQKPTDGVNRLDVALPSSSGSVSISVLFVPEGAATAAVTPRPLDEWQGAGPTE